MGNIWSTTEEKSKEREEIVRQHPGITIDNIVGGPTSRKIYYIRQVGGSIAYVEEDFNKKEEQVIWGNQKTPVFPFIHSLCDINGRLTFVIRDEKEKEILVHGEETTTLTEKVDIGISSLVGFEGRPMWIGYTSEGEDRWGAEKTFFVLSQQSRLGPFDLVKKLSVVEGKPTFAAKKGALAYLVHGSSELFNEFNLTGIRDYDFEDGIFCVFGEVENGKQVVALGNRSKPMELPYSGGVLFKGEPVYKCASPSTCSHREERLKIICWGDRQIGTRLRHCGSPVKAGGIVAFWYKEKEQDKSILVYAKNKDELHSLEFDYVTIYEINNNLMVVGRNCPEEEGIRQAFVLPDELTQYELRNWEMSLVLDENGLAYIAKENGKMFARQGNRSFPVFEKASNLISTKNGLAHIVESNGQSFVVEYKTK